MKLENLKKLLSKYIIESKAWFPPINRKNYIKLDLNEGYHVLNKEILDELRNFDPFVISSYPEYDTLLEKLSNYTGADKKELCLTNGSDHGIQMLCSLFVQEGDKVLIPSPTFFPYFSVLNLLGAKVEPISYIEVNGKFVFPYEATLQGVEQQPKVIMLCNPNNPLGASIPEEQITTIVKSAHRYGIPVVIDEAYFEFGTYSAINLMKQYDNIILLRTFSKAFGLAGLRLGYIIASETICNELSKLKLAWTVNHFSVFAGEVVLNHVDYFMQKIQEVKELKAELKIFLIEKGYKCYDTDTNFIIVKTYGHTELIEKLRSEGILVNDVSHYPFSNGLLENAIRISTPSREDLDKLKEKF